MRRPTRLALTAALAASSAALLAVPPTLSTPAYASARSVDTVLLNGFEAGLVKDINAARHDAGLRPLDVVPGATDVARRWTWVQAKHQTLMHNPKLVVDLERAGSRDWHDIAENVGTGPAGDPDVLFRAYMASPPHRENILDSAARFLGVGTVERNGSAWNTLDFVDAYSSAYGHTRVPADGLVMDRSTIVQTTEVAGLENHDQRFTTGAHGGVRARQIRFTGPSTHNDAAVAKLVRRGRHGFGAMLMRTPLDLSHADGLSLQLATRNPRHRSVPVRVILQRSFGGRTVLGTVRVGRHSHWFDLPLPNSARGFRNLLVLKVGSHSVGVAGGRARLLLFDLRAKV